MGGGGILFQRTDKIDLQLYVLFSTAISAVTTGTIESHLGSPHVHSCEEQFGSRLFVLTSCGLTHSRFQF